MCKRPLSRRSKNIMSQGLCKKLNSRLAVLRSEEDKLKEADLEVQQELIVFGQVLDDLRQKSYNAKRKIDNEEKEIRDKEELIRRKKEELKKITDISMMIEKKVNAMHKYEEFLEKVKSQYSDEFSEMTDILNRYETLKKTNKELVEENQYLQEDLDKVTNEASLYEKEKGNEILRMNNNIAELQKSLEKSEDERNRKQRAVEDTVKNNRVQSQQLSKLLMAVNNLYWMCKKDRKALGLRYENEGTDVDPFGNTKEAIKKSMGQLEVVGQFMEHYNSIMTSIKQSEKANAREGHDGTKKNFTQTKTGATHHQFFMKQILIINY
eukprot:TRINITY_DN934_c3_g1_i1.p4 TRINITY_DN934_c3_g1~~TRINITY_DN934_c3_g1_i1.p4  ORF type:complete len:323 (+),score=58.36 TRINITY_DN934_c3_g1_i1:849-1817(+)